MRGVFYFYGMSKIVITGTGRCGTTFLIQLLTNCGFNTGFTPEECISELNKHPEVRGGIEHLVDTERFNRSYIVKNPDFIKVENISKIDCHHVIIPIRDLEATAKSRELQGKDGYRGFSFGANSVEEQKAINSNLMYQLLVYLSKENIPITFINFDNMIKDSRYLYSLLQPILGFSKSLFTIHEEHKKLANHKFIRF